MGDISERLHALDGLEVPGGCDYCDAIQRIVKMSENGTMIKVMHDDDCPWWIEYQRRNS